MGCRCCLRPRALYHRLPLAAELAANRAITRWLTYPEDGSGDGFLPLVSMHMRNRR